jgi:predicted  nucleic acid-binding Zn-ribbon protein
MKADAGQQRTLLELVDLDAELTRLAHRAGHLPEQLRFDNVQAEHQAVADRLAALALACEDLDGQVAKLESEVDTVRQREDRDRGLLNSGSVSDSKQLADLQHELGTLERRQANLEDTLLEVMERREQLAGEQAGEQATADGLAADLAAARLARDEVLAEVERAHADRTARRAEVAVWWAGVAAPVVSNSTAANCPGSPPPPKTRCCSVRSVGQSCCGSTCPGAGRSSEGHHRGRRRFSRQSRPGRIRVRGVGR